MKHTPKAYIACLASYNNGILHGEWIDLDGSVDVTEAISTILNSSPIEDAEEWAIHDYEYCNDLSEYSGLDTLNAIASTFEKASNESIEWDLLCEFCNHKSIDLNEESISDFSNSHAGSDETFLKWVMEFLEETGELNSIPDNLKFYFDCEAYARDLEISDVFTIEHLSDTHVFWNY